MNDRLPILVYGTLRPGDSNYLAFIKDYEHSYRSVLLSGYQLWAGYAYPYIIAGDGIVVCDLVTFADDIYDEAVLGLDRLEGYRGEGSSYNHYDRTVVTVNVDGVEQQAYVYVASNRMKDHVLSLVRVHHGDWIRWDQEENRVENWQTEVAEANSAADAYVSDDGDDDWDYEILEDGTEYVSEKTMREIDEILDVSVEEDGVEPIFEENSYRTPTWAKTYGLS